MGTWEVLASPPPVPVGAVFLLTDGSVLALQTGGTGGTAGRSWWRLTPDALGDYGNGSWALDSTLDVDYLQSNQVFWTGQGGDVLLMGYWSSAFVLGSGELVVTVRSADPTDAPHLRMYDPVGHTWSALPDPATDLWGVAWSYQMQGGSPAVLPLGDGTLLAMANADEYAGGTTINVMRYVPAAGGGSWIDTTGAGGAGTQLAAAAGLHDGRVYVASYYYNIGASVPPSPRGVQLYTPAPPDGTPGAWGPELDPAPDVHGLPGLVWPLAVVLPSNHVLVQVGPNSGAPAAMEPSLYEFDGATFAPVPGSPVPVQPGPNTPIPSVGPFTTLGLFPGPVLPTGQVLVNNGGTLWLYTPDLPPGLPQDAWRPTITPDSPDTFLAGQTYALTGTQLTGRAQVNLAAPSHFPIVRLQGTTGRVWYCRSFGFPSSLTPSTQLVSASFVVPADYDGSPADLIVVANGIPSVGRTAAPKDPMEGKFQPEILKLLVEFPKLKDAEGDPLQRLLGDPVEVSPETLREVLGQFAERIDQLTERILGLERQLATGQAFIRPDERPALGPAAAAPVTAAGAASERPARPTATPLQPQVGEGTPVAGTPAEARTAGAPALAQPSGRRARRSFWQWVRSWFGAGRPG